MSAKEKTPNKNCYILRKDKVFNDEFGIIKFTTKEDYKALKRELDNQRQYQNYIINDKTPNPEKYVMYPKNNHIKYILCGASGSGKTKNTMNILKIYCTLYKERAFILYFSPIEADTYRDETLHNIKDFCKSKIIFFNCEKIEKIPTLRDLQQLVLDLRRDVAEKTQKDKPVHCLCVFDDCESCTNRKVGYDNVLQSINMTIYTIINALSVAGRSHVKDRPTIEYICIQHSITIGGTMRAFNTILLESNILGFRYNSLTKKNKQYIEDKFGVKLIDPDNELYPGDSFVYLSLTYPHYIIFDNNLLLLRSK